MICEEAKSLSEEKRKETKKSSSMRKINMKGESSNQSQSEKAKNMQRSTRDPKPIRKGGKQVYQSIKSVRQTKSTPNIEIESVVCTVFVVCEQAAFLIRGDPILSCCIHRIKMIQPNGAAQTRDQTV